MKHSPLATTVARRYLAAAISEDKVRKSKGFPANTSIADVSQILAPLGFMLRDLPGLLLVEQAVEGGPEVAALHTTLKNQQIDAAPAQPTVGTRYVLDISDLKPSGSGYRFMVKTGEGVQGVLVTSPEGEKYHLLSDVGSPKVKTTNDFTKWLRTVKSFVAYLNSGGGSPASPSTPKTPSSTPGEPFMPRVMNTCPSCFAKVKTDPSGRVVLHGYTRPGTGTVNGRCFGVGYPCFELSSTGTADYKRSLQEDISILKKKMNDVENAPSLPHPVFHGRKLDRSEADPASWADAVSKAQAMIARDIQFIEKIIDGLTLKIRSWVKKG